MNVNIKLQLYVFGLIESFIAKLPMAQCTIKHVRHFGLGRATICTQAANAFGRASSAEATRRRRREVPSPSPVRA
eukprot:5253190-Amphidinium_carterae.2